jgi:hypothetical protein
MPSTNHKKKKYKYGNINGFPPPQKIPQKQNQSIRDTDSIHKNGETKVDSNSLYSIHKVTKNSIHKFLFQNETKQKQIAALVKQCQDYHI